LQAISSLLAKEKEGALEKTKRDRREGEVEVKTSSFEKRLLGGFFITDKRKEKEKENVRG